MVKDSSRQNNPPVVGHSYQPPAPSATETVHELDPRSLDARIPKGPTRNFIKGLFAAGDTDTDVEMLQSARYRLLIDVA